jgi:hypothetical protein
VDEPEGPEGSAEAPSSGLAPVLSEEGESLEHQRALEGMDERIASVEVPRQPRYHALDRPCEACS